MMRTHKHTPKHLRQYPYAPRPETPVVTVEAARLILGDLYGNTYVGPYVRVTHKESFEARVTKRAANAEAAIDTIESLVTEG